LALNALLGMGELNFGHACRWIREDEMHERQEHWKMIPRHCAALKIKNCVEMYLRAEISGDLYISGRHLLHISLIETASKHPCLQLGG